MKVQEAKEVIEDFDKCVTVKADGCYETIDYIKAKEIAIKCMEEVEQYRALGTVEELKEAREKQVAKKPRFYAHNYYCTECGNLVGNNEFEWQRFLYCDVCGQKIDWEEGGTSD